MIRSMKWLVASLVLFSSAPAQDVDKGQEIYGQICAQCHGVRLQGGKAQSLADGIWQFGSQDSHIRRNVKHGLPHLGMPAFEGVLTDDQIKSVVAFLKQREKESGVSLPPIPDRLQSQDYANIKVEIFADSLDVPWAIDFLDPETALITERPGQLRIVRKGQLVKDPVAGTPPVLSQGQGGLLDVAVDPDYLERLLLPDHSVLALGPSTTLGKALQSAGAILPAPIDQVGRVEPHPA